LNAIIFTSTVALSDGAVGAEIGTGPNAQEVMSALSARATGKDRIFFTAPPQESKSTFYGNISRQLAAIKSAYHFAFC
jgi:hypothetical protein